jgi:hypothetical protein
MIARGFAPVTRFTGEVIEKFDNWAVRNCPPTALNLGFGAMAPLRTIRLAGEQFRIGQTIHISSKAL